MQSLLQAFLIFNKHTFLQIPTCDHLKDKYYDGALYSNTDKKYFPQHLPE